MNPSAITDVGKTDPPRWTIGQGEKSEHPPTPLTPGKAADLVETLKEELETANKHWTKVNGMLAELHKSEEEEKQLLSAEVNRLRALLEKREEHVVSVVEAVDKLQEHVGTGFKGYGYEELYLGK